VNGGVNSPGHVLAMTCTDLSCNAGIHIGFHVQSFLQPVHYIVHVFLEVAPSVDRHVSDSSHWRNELPHVESRSSRTLSAGTLALLTAEAMVTRTGGYWFLFGERGRRM